jgi:hypothetical protein
VGVQSYRPTMAAAEAAPVVPDDAARVSRRASLTLLNRQFNALYSNNLIRAQPTDTAAADSAQRNWATLRTKVARARVHAHMK